MRLVGGLFVLVFTAVARAAEAGVGLTEIAGQDGAGVVIVYYPSSDEAKLVKHGPFASRAIDVVSHDARFAPLLALDRVGMYGMSAGGHTALSLAGGRWSPRPRRSTARSRRSSRSACSSSPSTRTSSRPSR